MIADLKPYPAYKDSGVPWLAAVPEHWKVEPNRALFEETRNQNHPDEPLLSVTISKGVIRQADLLSDTSKKDSSNLDKSKYKLVEPGEIAYNKMRAWQGAVGLSRYRGIISPAYIVQRPRPGVLAEYMHYLLRTPPFAKEAERWSYGITSDQWSLRPEHFKMIYGCLPPLPEQAAIVRFLDHADRRIRRYIRAKQKLIRLLEEQKQVIIHRAVTRGLDPTNSPGANLNGGQQAGGPKGEGRDSPSNVRLKPSGVEWLGDVPAHWDCSFLGRCLQRIEQGWSPVAAESEIAADQWAVLTLSSVKRGAFEATAIKPVPLTARIPEGIQIKEGDLLLTRSNTRELVGDTCVVQGPRPKTLLCDLIYRLTPEPKHFDTRFLMFQLLSPLGRRQIESDARGSSGTMPKIVQRHIRSWKVLVPPLEEQRAIAEAIDGDMRAINDTAERARTETDLLREYRTRLIADVVTGKLDVREAAAQLPDETEEPEDVGANDYSPLQGGTDDEPVDDLDVAKRAEG